MSSPFVRRTATVTAGVAVFAGLVATPLAAFADTPVLDPIPSGIPTDAVSATADPDGSGTLYTLTSDVTTYSTIAMPNDATLDGAGHTITAVENADHRNFPGSVLASAVGTDSAPAQLDVKNLHISTDDFQHGSNSGGSLNGIYMYRAGGSLTNVTVDGISHGNGVQEGNAISIRNRVSGDQIDVPRAQVALSDIHVTHYQKTGLLLDGNLSFAVADAHVGQGTGPQGQANPTMAANSLQISRGASGTVSDSEFALNNVGSRGLPGEAPGTAALLYNAKNVAFDNVSVHGDADDATTGIDVSNVSNTIDTTFTMRGGDITRTATPADGTGLVIEDPADAITATTLDTPITGWGTATSGNVTVHSTPVQPVVTTVDVSGSYQATRPHPRRLRVTLQASALDVNQVEGKTLRWRFKVDGRAAGAIRQHAGETDLWTRHFDKGTGTHTVEIVKNGVSQHTYKIHTS